MSDGATVLLPAVKTSRARFIAASHVAHNRAGPGVSWLQTRHFIDVSRRSAWYLGVNQARVESDDAYPVGRALSRTPLRGIQ